jgi:HEAT repeat protein
MRTPLLLSIFSYAFEHEEVAPGQLENLTEATLFDLYVRRRFIHEQAKSGPLDFQEDQARHHLGDLAVAMSEGEYLSRSIDRERVAEVLGAVAERFLAFAERMAFLQRDQHGAFQFVHLHLHAFFAGYGLTGRLEREEYQENSQTITLLGKIGRLAEPPLLRALGHPDVNVRLSAVNALGLVRDMNPPTEEAIELLRKTALEDQSRRVRELTMKAFVEMAGRIQMSRHRNAVASVLIRGVRDRAEDVRFAAAKALTVYVTEEVIPELLAVLRKGVENVTMKHLVESLGKAGAPAAVPYLTRLVRRGAISYMRGVPLLHWPVLTAMALGVKLFPGLMGGTEYFDLSAGTRSKAAWALGEIGCKDPDAVGALLALLHRGDTHHRITAAEALGKIGDADAAPALISVLNDEDLHLRSVAAYALGKIGHPSGIDPLLRMLGDVKNLEENVKEHWEKSGERDVYGSAAASLIQEFGADKVLEHGDMKIVLNHLSDEHPLVRVDAAEILGQLGHNAVSRADVRDKIIVPALIKSLDDKDSSVVLYVTKALTRIATPEAAAALKVRGLKTPPLFL